MKSITLSSQKEVVERKKEGFKEIKIKHLLITRCYKYLLRLEEREHSFFSFAHKCG